MAPHTPQRSDWPRQSRGRPRGRSCGDITMWGAPTWPPPPPNARTGPGKAVAVLDGARAETSPRAVHDQRRRPRGLRVRGQHPDAGGLELPGLRGEPLRVAVSAHDRCDDRARLRRARERRSQVARGIARAAVAEDDVDQHDGENLVRRRALEHLDPEGWIEHRMWTATRVLVVAEVHDPDIGSMGK